MFGSDELDRVKLDIMLDALKAMLDNSTLFVEPYVSTCDGFNIVY